MPSGIFDPIVIKSIHLNILNFPGNNYLHKKIDSNIYTLNEKI